MDVAEAMSNESWVRGLGAGDKNEEDPKGEKIIKVREPQWQVCCQVGDYSEKRFSIASITVFRVRMRAKRLQFASTMVQGASGEWVRRNISLVACS